MTRPFTSLVMLAVLASSGLALPAAAQAPAPGSDPIADLISGLPAGQGMDDDTAEAATATSPTATNSGGDSEDVPDVLAPPRSYTPPPTYLPAPRPSSRLPSLDRPVMIDELSRSPEAPPTAGEQAYEGRIRGGFNSAQGLQGPLDGNWILRTDDGRTLYSLQLVDRGAGGQMLEGAWRSLRTDRPAGQVGLVDSVERTAAGVYVRFTPRGAREASVISLSPAGTGWTGEMWESGQTRQVTLRRN